MFRYMVFISATSSAYALFAAISSCLNLLVTKVWFFFLMDQVCFPILFYMIQIIIIYYYKVFWKTEFVINLCKTSFLVYIIAKLGQLMEYVLEICYIETTGRFFHTTSVTIGTFLGPYFLYY